MKTKKRIQYVIEAEIECGNGGDCTRKIRATRSRIKQSVPDATTKVKKISHTMEE